MPQIVPKAHPIADEFPSMPETEYQELLQDIRVNGLKESIIMHEGMILDGRHRAKAVVELGWDIDDYCEDYDADQDGDPAKYVISRNIRRRHLSVGQRAGIVLAILDRVGGKPVGRPTKGNGEHEEETSTGELDGPATAPATTDVPVVAKKAKGGLKLEEAAATAGIAARRVTEVKEIKKISPKIAKEVTSGQKSINKGLQEAKKKLLEAEHGKSLDKIKKVCGGDFHQQVTQGGLKLKPLDVVEFCALTDAEMKACAKVMESGIPWNKVKMYLTMEVNPFTTYEQLKTLAIYRGGKLVY